MGIPEQVTIMGIPFTIKIVSKLANLGECDGPARIIKLKKGQKPHELESTLLHEIIHAILYVTGHSARIEGDEESGDEEALVLALEHGLLPIYKMRESNGSE